MSRTSLLEAIMPTHHKIAKLARTDAGCRIPDAGTLTREGRVGFVAMVLTTHLTDREWKAALETSEQMSRELRMLIVESGADEAGVVRHD